MAKKSSGPSFDDLDIGMTTMAIPLGGKGSKTDPNVYKGTYKGKTYTWHKGKATLEKNKKGFYK